MHRLTPQQIINVQLWIAALRSGDYTQGQSYLTTILGGGKEEDCCLGVGCKITPDLPSRDKASHREYGIRDCLHYMPKEAMAFFGLRTKSGTLENYTTPAYSLVLMNDGQRTFKEIAQVIEDNLLDNRNKLFVE